MDEMNEHLEKQYNRYFISVDDFIESRKYLESYNAEMPEVIKRSLLSSAIVAYWRPFSGNKGHDKAVDNLPNRILRELSQDLKELHDRIGVLRNEIVAHSDFNAKPVSRQSGGITLSKPCDVLWENLDISKFIKLINQMARSSAKKGIEIDQQNPL
jgi:hypothetical protein